MRTIARVVMMSSGFFCVACFAAIVLTASGDDETSDASVDSTIDSTIDAGATPDGAPDVGTTSDASVSADDAASMPDAVLPDGGIPDASSDDGGCRSPADTVLTITTAPTMVAVDAPFEINYRVNNRGPMTSSRVLLVGRFVGDARAIGGSTACTFGAGSPVFCSPGDIAAGASIMVRVSYVAESQGDLEIGMMANGTPMDTCQEDNEVVSNIRVTP